MSCLLCDHPNAAPYTLVYLKGTAMTNYADDVNDFATMPLYKVANELESSNAKYVRGLALHLGLPTRYPEGSIKPAGVLVAAIYEHIRTARQHPELITL